MITVDTREQRPLSQYWPEGSYIVATLKTGDYTDGKTIVERKSVNDLVNSCGRNKKRFMREVERKFDYLIIEGCEADIAPHLLKVGSRMTPQYIISCLKKLHTEHGILVMFAEREKAADIVFRLLS